MGLKLDANFTSSRRVPLLAEPPFPNIIIHTPLAMRLHTRSIKSDDKQDVLVSALPSFIPAICQWYPAYEVSVHLQKSSTARSFIYILPSSSDCPCRSRCFLCAM